MTEEATERSSLLPKNPATKVIDPSLSATNEPSKAVQQQPNGNSSDPESGSAAAGNGEDDNQLLKGNEDAMKQMYILFPAVSIGIWLSAADQTLVATTYGRIGSDLEALSNTSWIATGYFLTLTSFQPLYGKLSDIFGRKPALLFAYAIFGLGCVFCGLARNLNELVAARAFAGIGGGGMTTVVSILFSDIIPLRKRGSWQGYMNLVFAAGASAGAPLGGLLADSIGWRWAFLGQGPLCLLAIVVVSTFLKLPKIEDSHWKDKLKKIDFLGAFILTIAVATLLLGLDRGSNVAWQDKITIVCCCISIPLFAIFVFVEVKIASHPFAPGHIIFSRSLFFSYLCNFFSLCCHMSSYFYVPLYLQAVEGLSAAGAGVRMIPVTAFTVSGSVLAGWYMQWTGKYYWLSVSCMCLATAGFTILTLSSGAWEFSWGLIIGLCMTGFGIASVVTSTLTSVLANADPKDQAVATASTYLFRSLGSVIGISLSSTIVQQTLRVQLLARLGSGPQADKIVEKVRQSLDFIKTLDPKTKAIVTSSYQQATTAAFGFMVGLIVLALLSSLFIKEKKLGR